MCKVSECFKTLLNQISESKAEFSLRNIALRFVTKGTYETALALW